MQWCTRHRRHTLALMMQFGCGVTLHISHLLHLTQSLIIWIEIQICHFISAKRTICTLTFVGLETYICIGQSMISIAPCRILLTKPFTKPLQTIHHRNTIDWFQHILQNSTYIIKKSAGWFIVVWIPLICFSCVQKPSLDQIIAWDFIGHNQLLDPMRA